jgi:hypothetical protein
LFLVSIPFFLAAGVIESFVRQSALGTTARLGVAGAMGALGMAIAALTLWAVRSKPETDWVRDLAEAPAAAAPLTPPHNAAPGSDSGQAQ